MNRRQFLATSIGATLGGMASFSTLASQLQLGQALSAHRFSDYKALVCIFLYGGNDSFNLLIPTDASSYQDYVSTRQTLAVPREQLIALNQSDAMPLAMPDAASALAGLFNNGRASFVTNIGPMLAPATKTELLNNDALQPPQLFSHNDQQALWQNGVMDTGTTSGWGGRIADLLMDTDASLPLSFSLGGTNLFQSGRQAQHYVMNTDGVEQFGGLDPQHHWNNHRIEHYLRILHAADDTFSRAYAQKLLAVRENNALLSEALADIPTTDVTYGTGENLAEQLQMIARVIQAQSVLGQRRQIFFASLGGFDTHDDQVNQLPRLQNILAEAMAGFDADLQARGMADNVVTFTQSEFGRTLTSNGDGTDHGWAGHQVIMGTPIQGGRIQGDVPEQVINSQNDLGDGRMIPTTSIEQFGAQIAQWFGLGQSEIADVFPHYSRFGRAGFELF